MKKARCWQCGRRRPLSKVTHSMEDGDRVAMCRDERPCTLAYHRRELRWARRALSFVTPLNGSVRSFKARHAAMLARREARP